ncbi:DUF1499 domain-containing protein [Alphaproteobacteria bacterium GH1-50]|uniref:DUF1499 domain-containing protein n=1 Tax=Kangsaoukella pontilimi TaxID=2691042 RepID=A0A7C9IFH1_9RHOB|nr:DUF1499 domain-containing protein [Kangsaoukella pontilimi]MXQ07548.1 DUF1499 domain-containing protein [Kangsaoukella pontilimi]
MKEIIYLILLLAAAGMLWIRFAPHDTDRWHVDPAEVGDPRGSGVRLIGKEAPRFPGDPDTVLQELADIALSEPRVRILEGGVDDGLLTFVARTKLMGYPDYITFKAVAEGDETKLAVASRARFGSSDWGVNRDRLDRWFAELDLRLRP